MDMDVATKSWTPESMTKYSFYETESVMDASFLESEMEKISSLSEQPEETLKYTNQLLKDIDKQIEVSFEIMGERQSIIRQYIEKQQENELWRQDRFHHLMKGFTTKLNEAHDMLSLEQSISHSYNNFSTQTDTCELTRGDIFSTSNSQQITDVEPGYGTDDDVPNSIFQDSETISSQAPDASPDDESQCNSISNRCSDGGLDETGCSTLSKMEADTEKYYHIFHDNEPDTREQSQADSLQQCNHSNDSEESAKVYTLNTAQSNACVSTASKQDTSEKWQSTILQLKWLCKSIDTLLDCFNSAVEELQDHLDIDTSSGDFIKECMVRIRQYEHNENIERDIVKITEKQNESTESVGTAVEKLSTGRLDLNQWEEKLQELHAFQFTAFTDKQDHWLQQQVVRVIHVIKTIMSEQKFVVNLIKDNKPEMVKNGNLSEESESLASDKVTPEVVVKNEPNVDTDTESFTILSNVSSLGNEVIEVDPNPETQNNESAEKVANDSSESDCGKKFLEEGHRNILAIFNEIKSRMKKMENRLVDSGTCKKEVIENSGTEEINMAENGSRQEEDVCVKDNMTTQSVTLTTASVKASGDRKNNTELSDDDQKNNLENGDEEQPHNVSEESEENLAMDNKLIESKNSQLLDSLYPFQSTAEDNKFLNPNNSINIQEAYKLFKTLADGQKQKNVSSPLEKVFSGELPKGTYVKQVMGEFMSERCQIKDILTSINENVGILNNMIFNEDGTADGKTTDEKKALLMSRIMQMTNMANDISSQFEEKNKALSSFFLFDAYNKKFKRKISPPGIPNKFTKLVLKKRQEVLSKMFPVQDTKSLAKRIGCGNKNWKKKVQRHNLTMLLQATKEGKNCSLANGINSLIRSKRMKAIVKEARFLRTGENTKKLQYLCENINSEMAVMKRGLNAPRMFDANSDQKDCCKIDSNKKNNDAEDSKLLVFDLSSTTRGGRNLESKDNKIQNHESKSRPEIPEIEIGNESMDEEVTMRTLGDDIEVTMRTLGDDIEQIGNISMDELLNNTIVFEEEYESSLIAISKQLDNLEGDMLEFQSSEDEIMNYTTSPRDVEMWTDGLQKAMDKITKLNDAAVFYTKLTILFENGEQSLGEAAIDMSNNSMLMGHFQKITKTIAGLLTNTYSKTAGTYLRQVLTSVEDKINRVGAISDALIKHGIAKLKDVLGGTLITSSDENFSQNGISNSDLKSSPKKFLGSANEPCALVKDALLVSDRSIDVDKEETNEKCITKSEDGNNMNGIEDRESGLKAETEDERLSANEKETLQGKYINNKTEMGGEINNIMTEQVKEKEIWGNNGEVETIFDNECVSEEVYILKDSNEDINETLRSVVDNYSNTTAETRITDYLKVRIKSFATGINANSEFKPSASNKCRINVHDNESVDNVETLQEEIRKAEYQKGDDTVYSTTECLDRETKNKEEKMVEKQEVTDIKQESFSENYLGDQDIDDVYKSNDKDKDRLLKTVKKLKDNKKEIIDGNISTLKNVLQKIVSLEGKKSDLQNENIMLIKKLRDLDESLEHEIEDSRRSMTETFNKNIDRLMEKISVLTNELIDSEDEKLKVINEANNFKIDAETAYHEMQHQCKMVKEREQSQKVIVETLEAQIKRLSLQNGDLFKEMQVFKEQLEQSMEIRNLQSYENELKEERLKLDEEFRKINIEKKKLQDAKSSSTEDNDTNRNGEGSGNTNTISFNIFKSTQEERDKLSSKLIELNGNFTETKMELRKLKLQLHDQDEQHVSENDELITKIEKEFKQKIDAIQGRHFDETEQLVMSFNEENQKWEEEMRKLKRDLQEENQKQLAEQKVDHEFSLKKSLHDQATIGRSEFDELRQKYESMAAYKKDMLQQFQSEKEKTRKEQENEVAKLQNTIRRLWSNLKGMKKQMKLVGGQVENGGQNTKRGERGGCDGAEITSPHDHTKGGCSQQQHEYDGDKKLWDEILEDAVSNSPTKMKKLLTLMTPERERDNSQVRNSNKTDVSNDCVRTEHDEKREASRKYIREQYKKKLREENENIVNILVDLNDEIDKQVVPHKRGNY